MRLTCAATSKQSWSPRSGQWDLKRLSTVTNWRLVPFCWRPKWELMRRPSAQYGHGDVVAGLDEQWTDGSSPWDLTERDDRWYGRGTADNKGQHTINMAALRAVLATRGQLGFNCKFLIEMGEGLIGARLEYMNSVPSIRQSSRPICFSLPMVHE